MNIPILFIDDHVVAVNKPAGIAIHPLRQGEKETVFGHIVTMIPEVAVAGPNPREGGLVHRLDTDTSGILLAARTPVSYEALRKSFREGRTRKEYLALVVGQVPGPGFIDFPIGHHPTDRRKMRVVKEDDSNCRVRGRPQTALTEFIVERHLKGHTLLRVSLTTGRRHQVRVHLAALGYPLAGDPLYRGPRERALDASGLARHGLHAWRITFPHPSSGRSLALKAPLPEDIEVAMKRIETQGLPISSRSG